MTYDEFVEQIKNNFIHETIYRDSDGHPILVIRLVDAYYMLSKMPKREWVELTEDEYLDILNSSDGVYEYLTKLEAKLKEKNT